IMTFKNGIFTPKNGIREVSCAEEGCESVFIKNGPRHYYCKPCAARRKIEATIRFIKSKPKILGLPVKCVVQDCETIFIKRSAIHAYCDSCAVKQDRKTSQESFERN